MSITVRTTAVRTTAWAATVAISALAVGPAFAASSVARAEATAVSVTLAGETQGSGTVEARHDGESEQVSGNASPPVSVLTGQDLADFGVLAQEATASVKKRRGFSAACAGVAGDGGSVVAVGDSDCLSPGRNVGLTLANLDLRGLVVADPESALAPINQLTQPIIDQISGPLAEAVAQVRAGTGDIGLVGGFGAVQGRCTAGPSSARGSATLADAGVSLVGGPAGEIALVDLPVNPPPNTRVVTDLSVLATSVIDALRIQLTETFQGELSPLAATLDPVQQQIIDGIVSQVEANLAPLEDNVLDILLNAQERPAAGAIHVTALRASVLPGAAEFGAPTLLEIALGDVVCGPNGRVAAPEPEPEPEIPVGVSAGADGSGSSLPALLGVTLLVGLGAGARRALRG